MEGTILNRRYELKSLLGRSDLGALYLANDIANGELLAVKVFSGVVDLRGEDGTRYRNAVRRVEGFHHPHLLTPTAVDSSGGTAYQVAPYFPAQPLDALLESAPLKLTEIVTLLQQIASGLQALHGLGLVHGNLKPSNLLVSREEDRIHGVAADPFLTLLRGAATAHLEPGEAPFRAPEEVPWLDRPADARSDLYALGTLAYRLLAGRLPYPADDPVALIGERFAGPPPSPRDWNHVVPERLAAIVLRLLARQPQERYPSAAALLADLRDWAKPRTVPLGRFDTPHPTAPGDRVSGRESAQEAIRSALARAAMGEGSLLLLAGEAGLGKRSLFESLDFSMEASGALVLRAEVPAAGWSAPFQIPLALLSALLQRWEYLSSDRRRDLLYSLNSRVGDNGALLTGLLPELSTLLPKQEPPAPIPADRARPRMLAVLTDAICALAGRERPLVLWIGGLQRADGDSVAWLRTLFHRLGDHGVAVLGALDVMEPERPLALWLERLGRHPALHWVNLAPLAPAEAAAWVARRLAPAEGGAQQAVQAAQSTADWILRRWGGNPLVLEQAFPHLLEGGVLIRGGPNGAAGVPDRGGPNGEAAVPDRGGPNGAADALSRGGPNSTAGVPDPGGEPGEGGEWRFDPAAADALGLPDTLGGLIEARLAALPEALYLVLEAASIHPAEFELDGLGALLGHIPHDALAERIESLAAAGLLRRTAAGLRFAHVRFRDHAYRRLAPARRAQLHQLAAAHIEANPRDPALQHFHRLARHFAHGEESSRATNPALSAAEEARRHQALHGAARQYEWLLAALAGDERVGALYAALGECHARLGDPAQARIALGEALRLAPGVERQADTLAMLAEVDAAAGARSEALTRIEEALQLLGESLPAHPVGTVLARLATAAAARYHQLLSTVSGIAAALPSPEEERVARLLGQAAAVLAETQPARAALAGERILQFAAGRLPAPPVVTATIRLAEAEGDPDGELFAQAAAALRQRHLPHEEAMLTLVRARCRFRALQIEPARQGLAEARERFGKLRDPLGEADVLRAQLALLRRQGPATAVRAGAGQLARLADVAESEPLRALADGWIAYGEAIEARHALPAAVTRIIKCAENLGRTGDGEGARELWGLAAELHLVAGEAHSAIGAIHHAPRAPGTLSDALLRAQLAEAQLAVAIDAGGEAGRHLKEARGLVREAGGQRRRWPILLAAAAVLEPMLYALEEHPHQAVAAAERAAEELDRVELRLSLGWLAYRTAEALKAGGQENWMGWGGKALTIFDAAGAEAMRLATRRMLDLEQAEESPAPPMAQAADVEAASAFPWADPFAQLMERAIGGSQEVSAEFPRQALRILIEGTDAERGALYLADRNGALALRDAIPSLAESRGWINRWLVDTVWSEQRTRTLEHYRPGEESGSEGTIAFEPQAALCIPFGTPAGPRGVIYLSSTMSRAVFGEAERRRGEELARRAAAALDAVEALENLRRDRDRALGEGAEWRHLTEWGVHASEPETSEALLRGFLRDAAAPAGCSALAAIWWEPHLRRVELGPRLSTAADHFSPAALEASAELPVRAAEALERQQATVLRAERTEPAPDWEQAILLSLGAAQGVWLPLVNAGESFGAVLVAPGTPGADFDPEAQGTLQRALRVIAPALRRARVAELVQAEEASLRDTVSDLERRLGHARGLTPRAFRGLLEGHDGEPPAESLEVDGALVLSGQIQGLAVLSRQGHGRVRLALESYYRQVDEALALHHGHLEQTDQGGWIARFERGADSVLWAALTATQLLMAWRLQPNGDSDLATGFGIHTGRWVEAWIRTEHRIAPLALGPAAEVSSRLAELTFRYRTRILVSQAVVDGLAEPQRFELRPLGTLRLPQGGGRIGYHELYGTREAPERERMTERRSLWQNALQHYRRGEWRDAASGFRAYLADLPNDRPAKLYLRQCRRHLA